MFRSQPDYSNPTARTYFINLTIKNLSKRYDQNYVGSEAWMVLKDDKTFNYTLPRRMTIFISR